MAKKEHSAEFDESLVDTVLAQDINFSGTMRFSKSLMIKGKFEGDIDATGHLIIGHNAVVNATIKAGVITNFGQINGNVTALEMLELHDNARLNGDIETPDLIIESGCSYTGRCTMTKRQGGSDHSHSSSSQSQAQAQPSQASQPNKN